MAETREINDVQTQPTKARRGALRQLAEAALAAGAGFSLDAREVLDLLAAADLSGPLGERAFMVRSLGELAKTVTDIRARLVLTLPEDDGARLTDPRGLLGSLDGLRLSLSRMERDVRETQPSALVLGADGRLVGVVEDRVDDPRRDELLRAADAVLRARKDGTLDGSQWIDRLYQAWSNGGGPERAAMDSGAILGKRVRPCPAGPQGQRCTKPPGHDGWHEAPCEAPHHASADDLDAALKGQEEARRQRDAAREDAARLRADLANLKQAMNDATANLRHELAEAERARDALTQRAKALEGAVATIRLVLEPWVNRGPGLVHRAVRRALEHASFVLFGTSLAGTQTVWGEEREGLVLQWLESATGKLAETEASQ